MTLSRALDELEAAELAESSPVGRERRLLLKGSKLDVWKKAQEFLRTPVAGRHSVRMAHRHELPGPLAGLSALARYSMLAEPQGVVVAVNREEWRSLVQRKAAAKLSCGRAGQPRRRSVELRADPLCQRKGRGQTVPILVSARDQGRTG